MTSRVLYELLEKIADETSDIRNEQRNVNRKCEKVDLSTKTPIKSIIVYPKYNPVLIAE
jgi:hypothetical protein